MIQKKYNKHVNITLLHIYKFEINCQLNKHYELRDVFWFQLKTFQDLNIHLVKCFVFFFFSSKGF